MRTGLLGMILICACSGAAAAEEAPVAEKIKPCPAPTPGVAPPRWRRKVDPEYTEEARKVRLTGEVIVCALIQTSGRVENARVVKGLGLGLDEKAVEAVEQWEFKPALDGSTPVATWQRLTLTFRLL